MIFYCDGSRLKLNETTNIIGWGSCCDGGLIFTSARVEGTNINAEMLAIRDLLKNLLQYRRRMLENDIEIMIVTDSLTSIQIISGFLSYPEEYDLTESENYVIANEISNSISAFGLIDKKVTFTHIRGHGKETKNFEGSEEELKKYTLGNAFADFIATSSAENLRMRLIEENKERQEEI